MLWGRRAPAWAAKRITGSFTNTLIAITAGFAHIPMAELIRPPQWSDNNMVMIGYPDCPSCRSSHTVALKLESVFFCASCGHRFIDVAAERNPSPRKSKTKRANASSVACFNG